jgi:hypothetical protein
MTNQHQEGHEGACEQGGEEDGCDIVQVAISGVLSAGWERQVLASHCRSYFL